MLRVRVWGKLSSKRKDFFIQVSENKLQITVIRIPNQMVYDLILINNLINFNLWLNLVHFIHLCIYFLFCYTLDHQAAFVKSSASKVEQVLEIPTVPACIWQLFRQCYLYALELQLMSQFIEISTIKRTQYSPFCEILRLSFFVEDTNFNLFAFWQAPEDNRNHKTKWLWLFYHGNEQCQHWSGYNFYWVQDIIFCNNMISIFPRSKNVLWTVRALADLQGLWIHSVLHTISETCIWVLFYLWNLLFNLTTLLISSYNSVELIEEYRTCQENNYLGASLRL